MRKHLIGKSKKANVVLEVLIILVVLLIFGLVAMIGFKSLTDINTDLQADSGFGQEGKDIMNNNTNKYNNVFDGGCVFILLVLTLTATIFAFTVDTSPVFFTISILLLIVMMFVGALIATPFADTAEDLGTDTSFPKLTWIYNHLLTVIIVQGMFITMALYMNGRTQ